MLSQALLSKSFDENKYVFNINTKIDLHKFENGEMISFKFDKVEDVIEHFEQEECYIFIYCTPEYSQIGYGLHDVFIHLIPFLISNINKLEKEFGETFEELSPELLKDFKDCIKEILRIVVDSALNYEEIKVNIKEFTKTDDIGFWIYSKVIGGEELKPCLHQLEKLKEKIDKFRDDLIKISYA
jgi:hypothetical protein